MRFRWRVAAAGGARLSGDTWVREAKEVQNGVPRGAHQANHAGRRGGWENIEHRAADDQQMLGTVHERFGAQGAKGDKGEICENPHRCSSVRVGTMCSCDHVMWCDVV